MNQTFLSEKSDSSHCFSGMNQTDPTDGMEGAQGFGLGFSGDGRMDVDETHSAFVGVDARVRDDRDVRSRSSRSSRSSRDQDSFVRRSPRLRPFGRLVFVRSFPADDRWMSRDLIDFDFDFDSRRPSGVGDRWRRR